MKIENQPTVSAGDTVPAAISSLIERIKNASDENFADELEKARMLHTILAKTELCRWAEVLNRCDEFLLRATTVEEESSMMTIDKCSQTKAVTIQILRFTSLLFECSSTRRVYASTDRLLALLESSDLDVIAEVLRVLQTISKRSKFLTQRLPPQEQQDLVRCLTSIAQCWSGKLRNVKMTDCVNMNEEYKQLFPFSYTDSTANVASLETKPDASEPLLSIVNRVCGTMDKEARYDVLSRLRMIRSFHLKDHRMMCIIVRLLSISTLIYCRCQPDETQINALLYSGFIEETAGLLQRTELQTHDLVDQIQTEALRTLTSIASLEKQPKVDQILENLAANSYHGFLASFTRKVVDDLRANKLGTSGNPSFALGTALFSFIYHISSIEAGGEALLSCGLMHTLLGVLEYTELSLENISFATRCARIIDIFATVDAHSFSTSDGMKIFVNRLVHEVDQCRKEQPFVIDVSGDVDDETYRFIPVKSPTLEKRCHQQRSGLIKGLLTFIKRIIAEQDLQVENRHVMEGPLPDALMHIISNAEYYSDSIYHHSLQLLTNFIFQEPAQLSALQKRHVPFVMLQSMLRKELPNSKDVITSLGNVFTALCLNDQGLRQFKSYKPFDHVFRIVLSIKFIATLKRKRSEMTEAAQSIGQTLDDLLRHQSTLRQSMLDAVLTVIDNLSEICKNTQPNMKIVMGLSRNASKAAYQTFSSASGENQLDADVEPGNEDDERPFSPREEVSDDDEDLSMDEAPTTQTEDKMGLEMDCASETNDGTRILPLGDYLLIFTKIMESVATQLFSDQDLLADFVNRKGIEKILSLAHVSQLSTEIASTPFGGSIAVILQLALQHQNAGEILMNGFLNMFNTNVPSQLLVTEGGEPEASGASHLVGIGKASITSTVSFVNCAVPVLAQLSKLSLTGSQMFSSDRRNRIHDSWLSNAGRQFHLNLRNISRHFSWESTLIKLVEPSKNVVSTQTDPCDTMDVMEGVDTGRSSDSPSCEGVARQEVNAKTAWELAGVSTEEMTFWRENKPLGESVIKANKMLSEFLNFLAKSCCAPHSRRNRRHEAYGFPSMSKSASKMADQIFSSIYKDLKWTSTKAANSAMEFGRISEVISQLINILFDERHCPFHVMLDRFYSSGCHHAFCDVLKERLAPALGQNSSQHLEMAFHEWFRLAERLSNRTKMLHTTYRHMAPVSHFDAEKYLKLVHIDFFRTFCALFQRLSDNTVNLKAYQGLCESAMNVYKEVAQYLVLDEESSEKTPPARANSHNEHVRMFIEMGFDQHDIQQALAECATPEEVGDWLLARQQLRQDPVMHIPQFIQGEPGTGIVVQDEELNQMLEAYGNRRTTTDDEQEASLSTLPPSPDSVTAPIITPLRDLKLENDDSVSQACIELMPLCKRLMEQGSDLVFSCADMVICVVDYLDNDWKHSQLIGKIMIDEIIQMAREIVNSSADEDKITILATRVHFVCLLFEHMAGDYLEHIEQQPMVSVMLMLLGFSNDNFNLQYVQSTLLPSVLLWLDLYDKCRRALFRRELLNKAAPSKQLKWSYVGDDNDHRYNARSKKWALFSQPQQLEINKAFFNGKSNVTIKNRNRDVTLDFVTMKQKENDSTKSTIKAEFEGDVLPIGVSDIVESENKHVWTVAERKDIMVQLVRLLNRGVLHHLAVHSILSCLVRMTRDPALATSFYSQDGIPSLLKLKSANNPATMTLISIILRQCIDCHELSKSAVERTIRQSTNPTQPSYDILGLHEHRSKEWEEALNILYPIAVRYPDSYVDSMNRLVKIAPGPVPDAVASIQYSGKLSRPQSDQNAAMNDVVMHILREVHQGEWPNESSIPLGHGRMLSRANLLTLLAEIVKTHSGAAAIISSSKVDDKSYLHLLLEKFMGDKERETLKAVKILFAVIAACNHLPKAQESIVEDVKTSIVSVENTEPSDVCNRVIELCSLMSLMADNCPSVPAQQRTGNAPPPSSHSTNPIIKLYRRKKLCDDLVKTITLMSLSTHEALDACTEILRTLENLLKNVNGPSSNIAALFERAFHPEQADVGSNQVGQLFGRIELEHPNEIQRDIASLREQVRQLEGRHAAIANEHERVVQQLENQLNMPIEVDDDSHEDDDDDDQSNGSEESLSSEEQLDAQREAIDNDDEDEDDDAAPDPIADDSQQAGSIEEDDEDDVNEDPMDVDDLNNEGRNENNESETQDDEEDDADEDDYDDGNMTETEDAEANITFDMEVDDYPDDEPTFNWDGHQVMVNRLFDDWDLFPSPFLVRRDAGSSRLRPGNGSAHPMLVRPHHLGEDIGAGVEHGNQFGQVPRYLAHRSHGGPVQILARQNAIRRMPTTSRARPIMHDTRRMFFDRIFERGTGGPAFIANFDRGLRDDRIQRIAVPSILDRLREAAGFLEPLSARYIFVILNHIVSKTALDRYKKEQEEDDARREKASKEAASQAAESVGAAETATVVAPPQAEVALARNAWRMEDDGSGTEAAPTLEPMDTTEGDHGEDVAMDVGPPPSSAATVSSSLPDESDDRAPFGEGLESGSPLAIDAHPSTTEHVPPTEANTVEQPSEVQETTIGTPPSDAQPVEEAPTLSVAESSAQETPQIEEGMQRVPEEFRDILGDIAIPEGVDPAFLAALPDDMRAEVIRDHERQRRARRATNPPAIVQPSAESAPNVPVVEPIDQEFLAALPPELQEEIIQQHERAVREAEEAIRRANQPAPPPQPEMDGAAVIASLPPRERAQVLAEMDDSELQRLPQAMQDEARRARAQLAQFEPFAQIQRSVMRIQNLYMRNGDRRAGARVTGAQGESSRIGQMAGKLSTANQQAVQLLDRESLLILCGLFLESRISIVRLQKVIRLACSHATSCDFVIWCMRALLEKASNSSVEDDEVVSVCPSWLDSIMVPGVGQSERCLKIGKQGHKVWVHPNVSTSVCRNVLDALHTLAKTYPGHFVPAVLRSDASDCRQLPSTELFWQALINSSGKNIAKDSADERPPIEQLNTSPLAYLITHLSKPSFVADSSLQDRLLKLLHAIVQTLPDDTVKKLYLSEDATPLAEQLEVIVGILMKGGCGTEGFNEGRSLLLEAMRVFSPGNSIRIYHQMCDAVLDIGQRLRPQIEELVKQLETVPPSSGGDESKPSTSGSDRGRLTSARLQGDSVVVDGEVIAKQATRSCPELRLPAVTALTDKTGAQYNLLSALQTLTKIRDAMRTRKEQKQQEQKKKSEEAAAAAATAAAEAEKPAEETPKPEETTPSTSNAEPATAVAEDKQVNKSIQLISIETDDTRLSQVLNGLEDLWKVVSSCLLRLGKASDPHAVVALQPAAEAFFLVHAVPKHTTDNEHPDNIRMIEFAEKHREVLNQVLRQNSQALCSGGPFAILTHFPKLLDFDVKRKYFRKELGKMDGEREYRRADINVQVRRSQLFSDSFRELFRLRPSEWKKRFYIVFQGEEGQDAGGLLREWYSVITREIFNPNYALFITAPGDMVTYMINKASYINPEHLDYFKFVGRLIAKAIYDNKLLDCYFTRAFYKHILNLPVRYQDIESEDPAFFKSIEFLLDNPINDLGLDLTFSLEVEEFGVRAVRDLKPDGRKIDVTDENKHEYVNLVCQMKMTGSIRKQLDAFLNGFYEVIPRQLIGMFNEQELELLISGLPEIDIDDLANNTEYKGYNKTSPQIQWFWRALRSYEQEDCAKFLQFVTGTSKVPLQGFASLEGMNGVQRFSIHMDSRGGDRLPAAHTCFNQIDLPQYESFEKLRDALLMAIRECTEGFGFA